MRAFVIAMRCEADAVEPHLKPGDRLYVAGIGKVNAAAATQKAICEGADEIWNVGLCGGFGDDIAVGDIYGVESATEYDFDLAKINGVSVGTLDGFDTPYLHCYKPAVLRENPPKWFKGWKILATGDRFNDSEADHELITKTLCASLRDMEGAAVAHVCKMADVRCVGIKCVSDVAGRGAMTEQYMDNRVKCLVKLSAAVKELLG